MAKEIDIKMSKSDYEKKQIEAMRKLGMNDEEIKELMAYDKDVNADKPKLEHDLKGEKARIAQEITRTTGMKEKPKEEKPAEKAPTVYKLDNTGGKRSHKKNATKAELIEKLTNFLSDFVEDIEILNAEKLIAFKIGENNYELDLKQKRKPKN